MRISLMATQEHLNSARAATARPVRAPDPTHIREVWGARYSAPAWHVTIVYVLPAPPQERKRCVRVRITDLKITG